MSENSVKDSMTEEKIVGKVAELMKTLDEVKKYDVLDKYFKKFAVIVISSIVICILANIALATSDVLSGFDDPQRFLLTFLLTAIPIGGIGAAGLFIRGKIKAVKTGEWKEELSHGFPSALKILSEMDWDSTFNAVSSSGLHYAMYSLVKGAAYWIITYFAAGFAFNITTYLLLHQTRVLGGISLWVSLLIIFVYLKKDLSRRFNEIRALDKLQWELRRLSIELRNTEF